MAGKTLYDKVWESHVIEPYSDDRVLLYIDRHMIHEVTSPQAFEGLFLRGRELRNPGKTLAVADHNTPTKNIEQISDEAARIQLEALARNVEKSGVEYYPLGHQYNGIVHVTASERGFILPGTTAVCGDSHTATHGAVGALAFGIGTSEIEQVMATQTLIQRKLKNMRIRVEGTLHPYITPKDVILYLIGQIGTAGGTGYAIEFAGSVFREMSMAGRLTVCNMGIEAGARVAMVAPDETTFSFLKGRGKVPQGEMWDRALAYWQTLRSDEDAKFDSDLVFRAEDIEPQVSWGTSPEDVVNISGCVPVPANETKQRALEYMGLTPGTPVQEIVLDKVFIGSCTNSRLEDLRAAAEVLRNRKVAPNIKQALVVPGSMQVRLEAEREGLDQIFRAAGFEWRLPGCSMCLAMNGDELEEGERCASTSNRNFEGRQGRGGRTHLLSPYMAAAAAVKGRLSDVRELLV